MTDLVLHPEAEAEYDADIRWYRRRSRRAADKFVSHVRRVFNQIAAQPDRFGWYDDDFREAVVPRFPYSVVYRVRDNGDVLVVAVAHASREPGYWRDRV